MAEDRRLQLVGPKCRVGARVRRLGIARGLGILSWHSTYEGRNPAHIYLKPRQLRRHAGGRRRNWPKGGRKLAQRVGKLPPIGR